MSNLERVHHFCVTPAVMRDDGAVVEASLGTHTGWVILGTTNSEPIHLGFHSSDELAKALAALLNEGTEQRSMEVSWIDEAGKRKWSILSDPMSVCDELMQFVIDETPDDNVNTDDHPLEELRTILIDLDMIVSAGKIAPGP